MISLFRTACAVLLFTSVIPADAQCIKKEVCDENGCRWECYNAYRVQRVGEYFQFEIPKANPDLLKELVAKISSEPVLNAKNINGDINIIIMSVPPNDAEKILNTLVPNSADRKLPE